VWEKDHLPSPASAPAKDRLTWQEKIDFEYLLQEAEGLIGEGTAKSKE
jgi:hypothetical protein